MPDNNPFKPATRSEIPLRLAIHGPSKSGKTYTALCVACMLAQRRKCRPAVIDSEQGRARLYAGSKAVCEGAGDLVLDFDLLPLIHFEPENYSRAIKLAADAGYKVLVIDGLSQAWETLLETIEGLTQAKYRGNSFRAWGEGTPIYRRLMASILDFSGDVVVTMRSKTTYEVETVDGKAKPKKVGLQPVMRDSAEYEFDHVLAMDGACGTLDSRSAALAGKVQRTYSTPGRQFLAAILGE